MNRLLDLLSNFHEVRYTNWANRPEMKVPLERYLEKHAEKKTLRTIADELGVSTRSVVNNLRKQGIVNRGSNGRNFNPAKRILKQISRNRVHSELTLQDIEDLIREANGFCQLTGVPIVFAPSTYAYQEGTASLDRIDSSLGYVRGNVRFVHKTVNMFKGSIDDETLYELSKAVVGTLSGKFS